MAIRERVARLLAELPKAPQYPTQGATLFIDLERQEVHPRTYTPAKVFRSLLAGRGANMFYLFRLLDESLDPTHPDIPLDLRLRRADRDRAECSTRKRHVLVTRVRCPDGQQCRRLLSVVPQDEWDRSSGHLRPGCVLVAREDPERAWSTFSTPHRTSVSTTSR